MTGSTAEWRYPVPYTELSEGQQQVLRFLWDGVSKACESAGKPGSVSALFCGSAALHEAPTDLRFHLLRLPVSFFVCELSRNRCGTDRSRATGRPADPALTFCMPYKACL
jgi:hypothetical protein